MGKRQPIPARIADEVLFRNRNVCCICHQPGVQIHHINGKHSDNALSNLAILCTNHHDEASAARRLTKNLRPALVRKYKLNWESRVALEQEALKRKSWKVPRDSYQIRFEIKKTVFSLSTVNDKKEVDRLLDYLYNWHLLEGQRRCILENLESIHWVLNGDQISQIAARLYQFFWEYVGPKTVSMDKSGENDLARAFDLLSGFGLHVALFDTRTDVIKKVVGAIVDFLEISIFYNRTRLVTKGLRVAKEFRKHLTEHVERKADLLKYCRIVDSGLSRIQNLKKKRNAGSLEQSNVWR